MNGAIATLQGVRGRLAFDVSADTMEKALMELAVFVGAEGSRPEHTLGRGPDDLWLFNDASFVIEAKNEAESGSTESANRQLSHRSTINRRLLGRYSTR